jgi:hypothetical protein
MNSVEIFIKLIYAIFFTIYALLFFYIISEIIGPLNYFIFLLPLLISLSVCLLFRKKLKKLKNLNDFFLFTVSSISAIKLVALKFNHSNEILNETLDMLKDNKPLLIILAGSAMIKAWVAFLEYFEKK